MNSVVSDVGPLATGRPPQLNPVVEAPSLEAQPPWPWPIADRRPISFIRLSGEMSDSEVGLVLAQLVMYNRIKAKPTVAELLAAVIADEGLLLPGGVQASAGELEINPSCCCGLEDWRSWLLCLSTGDSPLAPWIESAGEVVRVWSDGGLLDQAPDAFAIAFERARFVAELERVERDRRFSSGSGSGRKSSASRTPKCCAVS